ncbi:hypothetical protein [Flaviflexus sp.]
MSRKLWVATGTLGVLGIAAGTGFAVAGSDDTPNPSGIVKFASATTTASPSQTNSTTATSTVSARSTVTT